MRESACVINIRDNGNGINANLLKRIFDLFYTTKTDGMALRLSYTKNIIECNHGKITVESEPGTGTSFIISFLT